MREFNYCSTPDALRQDNVLQLLLSLRESKGRQVSLKDTPPKLLSAMHEQTRYASTEASNSIEGIITSKARLKQLVADQVQPKTRSEEEIVGYLDALKLIYEEYEFMPIKPSVILQIHRDLMKYTGLSYGGKWKDSDNQIIARHKDGSCSMRFTPTTALATPDAMDSLCESYNRAIAEGVSDPLLISIRFVFDFLCIHPFNDGNGRMSRILTTLLLEKCGYVVPRYISIEEIINNNVELYYESLAESSIGWDQGLNDESHFVSYMFGTIAAAYYDLYDCVEASAKASTKAQRIADSFEYFIGRVSKEDIRKRCPDISDTSIERELKNLLDQGKIKKVGGGRTTAYVKI